MSKEYPIEITREQLEAVCRVLGFNPNEVLTIHGGDSRITVTVVDHDGPNVGPLATTALEYTITN